MFVKLWPILGFKATAIMGGVQKSFFLMNLQRVVLMGGVGTIGFTGSSHLWTL